MPIAEVQLPNGKIAEVEFPQGASHDDILGFAMQSYSEPTMRTVKDEPMYKQIPESMALGFGKAAAGAAELGLNLAQAFGADVKDEKQNIANWQQDFERLGKGTGAIGVVSELAGNPLTYLPVAKGVSLAKQAAGSGVLFGATNPTGNADSTISDNLENAGVGTALGLLTAGTIKAGGNVAKSVINTPSSISRGIANLKTPIMTADEIAAKASNAYARAEQVGGTLRPEVTNGFLNKVSKMMPQTPEGRLLAGDSAFTKVTEKLAQFQNNPLTLRAVQEIDEFLGDSAEGFIVNGRMTKDGKRLLDIQSELRNEIYRASPRAVIGGKEGFNALRDARNLWSQSAKMRDIERIIQRADGQDNAAMMIKTGFRTLYNNPKRMRGFSAEQKELIRKAAGNGIVPDALRVMGSRLNPIAAMAGGGVVSGAAAHAGAAAARSGAEKLYLNRADDVLRSISRNVTGEILPPLPIKSLGVADDIATRLAVEAEQPAISNSRNGQKLLAAPTTTYEQPQELPPPAPVKLDEGASLQGSPVPSDIVRDEGLRHTAYSDTKGNRTVGYGFNMDSGIGEKVWKRAGISTPYQDVYDGKVALTDQQAQRVLQISYEIATEDAAKVFSNFGKLPPHKQEALVNLSYHHGLPSLRKKQNFIAAVNNGNWNKAVIELSNAGYLREFPNRGRDIARKLLTRSI